MDGREPDVSAGRQAGAASRPSLLVLAFLSAGAGLAHAAAAPGHLMEGAGAVAFFVLAAAFQVGWALAIAARPSGRLLVLGAAVNAGIVAVWALSRTAGLPIVLGGHGGPEPVAALDALATALEVGVVAGSLALRTAGTDRLARPPAVARIALPIILTAVPLALLVVDGAASGAPAGGGGAAHAHAAGEAAAGADLGAVHRHAGGHEHVSASDRVEHRHSGEHRPEAGHPRGAAHHGAAGAHAGGEGSSRPHGVHAAHLLGFAVPLLAFSIVVSERIGRFGAPRFSWRLREETDAGASGP